MELISTSSSDCSSSAPPRIVRMSSSQHRILIYTTCYNVLDGVTLTIRKLEQEILSAGHHLCILTTKSGDSRNTHLDGTHPNRTIIFLDNSVPIPFLSDPSNPEVSYHLGFGLSTSVKRQVQEFEPSLIHITAPDCTALHVIQYARTYEIPIMGTYHSNIPEYMEHYPGLSWLSHILSSFFRHQYNFLQSLFVPTPFIARHLQGAYGMDQVTSLKVWGRGVDVEHFHPHHASLKYRRDLGIPDDRVVVLWVGRLVNEKRVDIFARVVRELVDRGYPVHALVVGAGPADEEIRKLPNTTYTGWMKPDQLSVAYASSDIFLFPSSVETFGNVTLEAMASGLPVVVESGCSGHLVQHHCNGYACPAGNFESFFEATLALVKNDELRQSFSATSRSMSLCLEKRAVVRQMLEHYTNVTDEFYTVYSGRHCNRDAAMRQPGSFRGGNHPRPILLVLIEYLFILIFQVAWNMITFIHYSQTVFLGNRRVVVAAVEPTASAPPSPARKAKSVSSSSVPVRVIPRSSTSRSPRRKKNSNRRIAAPEEPLEVDGKDAIDSDQSSSGPGRQEPQRSSIESSKSNKPPRFEFLRGGVHNAIGDCRLSHTIVKIFLRMVEFQCRMESKVRNRCSCQNSWVGRNKRKISVDYSEDYSSLEATDEPETEVPVVSSKRPRQQQRRRPAPISIV